MHSKSCTSTSGVCVLHASDEFGWIDRQEFSSKRVAVLPPYSLAAGQYIVEYGLSHRNYEVYEVNDTAISFEVAFTGKMSDKTSGSDWKGVCGPGLMSWTFDRT